MGTVENAINNKEDSLPAEAKEILKTLASKWGDTLDLNELQLVPLKGAMTNHVFQLRWPTIRADISRKVLLRIYGEGVEVFFDRNDEIRTFEFMSKRDQGPRLLGRFPTGRIEEFIYARTLSASDLHDPNISALIATKMKELHDLDMPGPKNVVLWDRLRHWLTVAKSLSPPEEAKAFRLDTIMDEISILQKGLSRNRECIGFCHNDLQYGNIMIDENTKSLTIIDYEYSSYNPVAYDIANHFCERAANYHTETPHILDYSKYPGLQDRQRFVRLYLSSSVVLGRNLVGLANPAFTASTDYDVYTSGIIKSTQPKDHEVEKLVQDIEKYTLANHLFWGVWGIISEHANEIDFDYMEYARQRLEQYWLRKPVLLGYFGART